MGKLAVLELHGDVTQQELQAKLRVGGEGEASSIGAIGTLPANPELATCMYQWQQVYRRLILSYRIVPKRVSYGRSTVQLQDVRHLAIELVKQMQTWLASESFRSIETTLRTALTPTETIRVLIQTDTDLLRRLPWHCWHFLRDYSQAEVAFAAPTFQFIQSEPLTARDKVQILAILGHSQGINVQQDRQFLASLPQAQVTFLVEPQRQVINDHLWEQPWNILFFAGHSTTEGDRGRIYHNPQESLCLDEIEYGLRQAIATGLQLAIFNSCDGLGLAHSLERLQVPQLIVMREPVPDWVAQLFLKQFLKSFTSGQSLYRSVRQARERLQGVEDQFPCASWLPVLCQNPALIPPTWQDLVKRGTEGDQAIAEQSRRKPSVKSTATQSGTQVEQLTEEQRDTENTVSTPTIQPVLSQAISDHPTTPKPVFPSRSPERSRLRLRRQIQVSLLISCVVLILLVGVQEQGWLKSIEFKAFDQLMQLRPDEGADPRLYIVKVTDADIKKQRQNGESLQRLSTSAQTKGQLFGTSLSDESLSRLLQVLSPARAIGLDIYRDFPVEPGHDNLKTLLQTMPQLITVCKAEDFEDAGIPSVDAPPESPVDRVGFSDFVPEADEILQQHLLGMKPHLQTSGSQCNSNRSLSIQIASTFLLQQGITVQFTPAGDLQLGNQVFKVLRSQRYNPYGGEVGGSRIFLNYRATREIAESNTLTEVLENEVIQASIKDKVVLIGTVARGGDDYWSVPYGVSPTPMPGVMVQAHLISELLSAALDQRPLLQVWERWQEIIWMGIWAIAGTILAWRWQKNRPLMRSMLQWINAIALAIGVLYGLCWSAFLHGFWIPLIPAGLAVVLSSVAVLAYRLVCFDRKQN